MKITTERVDDICHRIMDENGRVLGFAMKLTNTMWCLTDDKNNRLSPAQYGSAERAEAAMQGRMSSP